MQVVLFGIDSALCGVSDYAGGYKLLLIARVIQAIGGGGIMPIVTAFIGQSFPKAKRGAIENTFQQTLNSGFAHLFIASAVIAIIGFIFALFLNNKEKQRN